MVNERKRRSILAISLISFSIFITIGIVQSSIGQKVNASSGIAINYPRNKEYFRLEVEKGRSYSIYVDYYYGKFPDPQLILRVFSHSLKILGIQDNSVVFTALHNGLYYVTIKNSNEVPFRFNFYPTKSEITTKAFMNMGNVTLFMLLLMASIGGIRLVVRDYEFDPITMYKIKSFLGVYRYSKKMKYKQLRFNCPQCGKSIKRNPNFCDICGHIFI